MINSPVSWMAIGALLLLPACCNNSKAGDTCAPGKAACADKTTELVCQDGRLQPGLCRGPKGCSVQGDKQHCDISGNAEGDTCALAQEGHSQCAVDPRRMVVCRAGKYELHQCRGPKGCEITDGKVSCDRAIQMESDRCTVDGSRACSMDNKRMLVCKGGKFVINEYCRGPKACDGASDKLACDRGPQNANEPCHKPGEQECGVDGRTLLACKSGRWEVETKCPGKCTSAAGKAACE